MKYIYRVFLLDGLEKKDVSEFLTYPLFLEDKLNEELATGEIILDGMPISSKKMFKPKSKIIIERYAEAQEIPEKVWNMVVAHDDFEEYVGAPTICCHRIHLIEPSVIAQGMHVDNIALTYELKDVNLNYKTIRVESDKIKDKGLLDINNFGYAQPVHSNPPMSLGTVHFVNSYNYKWYNTNSLGEILYQIDGRQKSQIKFTIPTLMCQGCLSAGEPFSDLFEMVTKTKVLKRHYKGQQLLSEDIVKIDGLDEIKCGPLEYTKEVSNDVYKIGYGMYMGSKPENKSAFIPQIYHFGSSTTGLVTSLSNLDQFSDHITYDYSPSTLVTANKSFHNKTISFETETLTEEQMLNNERYEYVILCEAENQQCPIYYDADCIVEAVTNPAGYKNYTNNDMGEMELAPAGAINVKATFFVKNMAEDVDGGPFLKQGKKYSAFDLVRKALLTTETRLFDNEKVCLDEYDKYGNKTGLVYPIYVDDRPIPSEPSTSWATKLKLTKINETIFENKNLWEVFLQIGYYIHAIPKLEFAKDGTDRFVLTFRQLGSTIKKPNDSTKITLFNSQNVNEYFSQFDSYVTNLFSPQNEVEEWVVPKSSDNSFLAMNTNALLILKYGISEITELDVTYRGETRSILDYVFEKSVYSVLNSFYKDELGNKITPSRGAALYYELGDNKIQGLNYVAPSVNGGDSLMALKNIVAIAFGLSDQPSLKFNELLFRVKYKTQDSTRIIQFRPDLDKFIKNSSIERYPHHEQFYGQQDKIIDSERFSANLFGRLLRSGNDIKQYQESATPGNEREAGDLVEIEMQPFYVTAIENELYPDGTYQKVTYSKNFNQLSYVVTIPSEPRFYEVGVVSKERREAPNIDLFKLQSVDEISTKKKSPIYLSQTKWKSFLKKVIFNIGNEKIPNFAYVTFLANKLRDHGGIADDKLFPSSEIERTSNNSVKPKDSSDHASCIVPVLHFPLRNGIIFECDMDDNFKAGDFVDPSSTQNYDAGDEAYNGIQALRYCDINGRADVYKFGLFYKKNWTFEQAQQLPKPIMEPVQSDIIIGTPSDLVAGLDKDNREEISINYQISLLYDVDSSGENFVTFPNLFGEKKSQLKCCLLSKETSMFNDAVNFSESDIIMDDFSYSLEEDEDFNVLKVVFDVKILNDVELGNIKSIVFYETDGEGNKAASFARNVSNIPNSDKLKALVIAPTFNN